MKKMKMKYCFQLLPAITALCLGPRCLGVQAPVLTAKAVSGTVQAEFPGSTLFTPVSAGEKLPVGTTIRTEKLSDALISLLPGFCIKIDGNSLVTVSSVNYENSTPPKRSVLVDLHSGRMVAILERYFPGRTSFFVQTGEPEEGNIDAKDKNVARGGAWDPGSCGAAAITADSGSARITQVVGTGSWTEADGTSLQIPTGDVVVDDDGQISGPVSLTGNAAATADQAYAASAVRDAIGYGLVDQKGCPGFSQFSIPGGTQPVNDQVLGFPLNEANAGLSTVTGTLPPAGSSRRTVTPPPTGAPPPTGPVSQSQFPPPVISPCSLPERPPS